MLSQVIVRLHICLVLTDFTTANLLLGGYANVQ